MTGSLSWPPPAGFVAHEAHEDLVHVPAGVELRPGTEVARTPPALDFAFFPGQTGPGGPWSVWGDGLAVGDHRYYTAIGDHLSPSGTAQVYEVDAAQRRLRQLVDLRTFLREPGRRPPDMQYTPAKIHTCLGLGRDGWLYYSTHRGSTQDCTTDARGYRGDWIFRTHPETAITEIVVTHPVAKHTIPAGMLDGQRMIFYGGTAPGNDADVQEVCFLAYDVARGRTLQAVPGGFKRYAILAQGSGRVFWEGHAYDPDTDTVRVAPQVPEVRSATRETAAGKVYGTTGRSGAIWSFDTATEAFTELGEGAPGEHGYTTSMAADSTGRFLYYVPGAHGGIADEGTPVLQFDVARRTRRVIAFLAPFCRDRHGYTPDGTFAVDLTPDDATLYLTWNGNRTAMSGSKHWDTCAVTVLRIPASERAA